MNSPKPSAAEILNPSVPVGWKDPKSLPADLRSHFVDPATMDWQPSKFPGITTKVLYADPVSGMSTILFKLEPGAVVPLHEHTALEQTWMLEGSLVDQEGEAKAGQYVWRPGGHVHQAYSPNGAVLLSIFMKPNLFANGNEFFVK
jgi:anti-sigma factor ChrR (cupin superfamily)